MRLTAFDRRFASKVASGQTSFGYSSGSNNANGDLSTGGDVVGEEGEYVVVGLRAQVSLASNIGGSAIGDVLTIIQTSPRMAKFTTPSNAVSAGSNSTRVSEGAAPGVAVTFSPSDHRHDGIGQITASSSNTLQRGTFNLRAGTGIALSLSDGDGDGEFDTATIVNTAGGSGGGGGATTLDSLTDVDTTGVASGNLLGYDGANWVDVSQITSFTGSGLFRLSGIITSTINADQNNWAPAGIHTNSVIRFTSFTALRTITGIDAGLEGEVLMLVNNTGQTLQIPNESGSSSAANRFRTANGGTISVRTSGSLLLIYVGARWSAFIV